MSFLQQRQKQLTAILRAWNQLDPNVQQASINLIIPLIESASLLSSQLFPSPDLDLELKSFQRNYQTNYHKDISALGASDLAPDSMEVLEAIYKIDQSDKPLEAKRSEVAKLAEKFGGLAVLREKFAEEIANKYQNAHARVSYNYGKFISKIYETKDQEFKEGLFIKVRNAENEEDFFKALLELNKVADIPSNFDLLKKHFGIDGLEEHTSINQGTLYRANLDNSDLLDQIERFSSEPDLLKKAQEFFIKTSALKSIKVDTKGAKQSIVEGAREAVQTKAQVGITAGFEMEFLLLPIGGPEAEKKRQLELNLFEKFNEGFADLDSRKLMREKYDFPHDKIAHTANALLLFSESEIAEIAKVNGESNKDKRAAIKSFLAEQKDIDPKLLEASIKNIDLLSIEEIFFLDLLFLQYDKAVDLKLNLDGVFESTKSLKENLGSILPHIANQGALYAKTLDMIRAHEIAFGPFDLSESLAKKDEAIAHLRDVAETYGLRAKDRDVQINVGATFQNKSVLGIDVQQDNDGRKKVTISESAVAVIKAIQTGLQKAIEENPWIDRKGQETIVFAVDRRKVIGPKLKGSEYIIIFDAEKMPNEASAFPVHRSNTGKSGMMRLALIDGETGVIELRLIGNNTHVPHHDGAVREVLNGIDLLPEIILASVAKELGKLGDLSKLTGRVAVNPDGSVREVAPIFIDHNANVKVSSSSVQKASVSPLVTTKEYTHS